MANGIQVRNRLAECITRAADETDNAELRRQLRALARTVLAERAERTDARVDQELLQRADELLLDVRQGRTAAIGLYIQRIEALLPQRTMPAQGGKKMGLLKRISNKLGGAPKPSAADAARNEVDAHLFELEKKIALLSEKRKHEVEKLRQLVGQAASLDASSFEYQLLSGRAGNVKKQIAQYEEQSKAYFRALMDNERYKQLMENGQAMEGLAGLVPDTAEADVLLDQLSQRVEDVRDRQDTFAGTIQAYEKRMNAGANVPLPEDGEFDQAVAAVRGEPSVGQAQANEGSGPAQDEAGELAASMPGAALDAGTDAQRPDTSEVQEI